MIKSKGIYLFFIALIFSFGLMFAFVELPRLIDTTLQESIGFPGFDQGSDEFSAYKTDLYIDALHLRWIGYASLLIIAAFILIGFLTRKSGWVYAGAFALFIPVFGQFALSMFFLAGLGILRVVWLPFLDISFNFLQLGSIFYLPYEILMWTAGLFNWNAHVFLSYLFMGSGAFLFVWGVLVWMQNRFALKGIASDSIYKFSRHPQYIGWIIWSYGVMLYSININEMKKSWSVDASLPWLLASMVIVGICLLEEIKMKEEFGKEYEEYRKRTHFFLPLPDWFKSAVSFPVRRILKKEYPETRGDAVGVTAFFTGIFILLSLFRVDFGNNNTGNMLQPRSNTSKVIDSLIIKIKNTPRRDLHNQFSELINLGTVSIKPLIGMLLDPNPDIREFSADALGELKADTADKYLVKLLEDNSFRVRNSAILSLGKLKSEIALEPLISELNEPTGSGFRHFIYNALGGIGSDKAVNALMEGTKDSVWFVKISAIRALCEIDPELATRVIRNSLSDESPEVRRNLVYLILRYKIRELKDDVSILYNDADFETRFYAKMISEQL